MFWASEVVGRRTARMWVGLGAGQARQMLRLAAPAARRSKRTAGNGPPPPWRVGGLGLPQAPPAACPGQCRLPSTSCWRCPARRHGRAKPWAPTRPAASQPAATRPACDEDGGSDPRPTGGAQCLWSPWSCFMAGCGLMPRAGALTSMSWRLPSLPSTVSVTGTVSPSLTWPLRSISMTW